MADICFVIQPFDGGKFDKRFDDVYRQAIVSAGLEPYRVDRDASVSIPIQQIERAITESVVCLADITLDNPNVWFELGYAIALNKELCIICSEERKTNFPFDVQHRHIIKYAVDSPQEQSLNEMEIACMGAVALLASGVGYAVSNFIVKKEMEKIGYNGLGTNIALSALMARTLLRRSEDTDHDGDSFELYSITELGWKWFSENLQHLNVKLKKQSQSFDVDHEIPF